MKLFPLKKLENSQRFALLKLFLHSKIFLFALNNYFRLLIAYIHRLTGRIGKFRFWSEPGQNLNPVPSLEDNVFMACHTVVRLL